MEALSSIWEIAQRLSEPDFIAASRQDNPGRYVQLLVLLQHPWEEVSKEWPAAVDMFDAPQDVCETTSLEELIEYALAWPGSSGWAMLSMNWLEAGAPANVRMISLVDRAVSAKRWTQRDRHRAFRFARRWERRHDLGNGKPASPHCE